MIWKGLLCWFFCSFVCVDRCVWLNWFVYVFFFSMSRKLVLVLGFLGFWQKYSFFDLQYDYGVLEFYINVQIMQLYYSKYYVVYVNNLNVIEEKYQEVLVKGRCLVVWF